MISLEELKTKTKILKERGGVVNYSNFAVEIFNKIKNTKYKQVGKSVDYIFKIEKNGKMYVLFEESNGKEDWKHNFQFFPIPVKPYKNMKNVWFAHRGFVKTYQSVRDEILSEFKIKYKEFNVKTVVIAGWSHGGALAQLFLEDLDFYKLISPACVDLCTFGSPRPFYSKKKAKDLDKKFNCLNFENGSDIVPKIPPLAHNINSIQIGENFNILKSFKTVKYHTDYGNKDLYESSRKRSDLQSL